MTPTRKGLRAAAPVRLGSAGETLMQEGAADTGVRGAMERRGWAACGMGTGLAGAGRKPVAEESWFTATSRR